MPICPSCGHDSGGPARFCPECGTPLHDPAPAHELRKTVTIVFCDVTGSTELGERLDPESLRRVMARYFEVARTAIERHGGTVEKFIGDAVMAVFGVPAVHEDDALRAVHAAHDLRAALVGLNDELVRDFGVSLELRTGINTGEVVTGTAERLATGDAVNVAARLEAAASPGEVLLGESTLALVRDAVEVEELPALALKGKAEPVPAYRLVTVSAAAAGHARRLDAPLVGRVRELRMLRDTLERVASDGGCHLFTILGPAGIGKSRLAAELLAGTTAARTLHARCLSYGEGITYWPLVEILLQLLGREPGAALASLGVDEPAAAVALGLLGEGGGAASTEDVQWGVRKVLEAAAATTPLVIVLDDVHWGEPGFLDLVEHVADWSRDAPILLLCLARPELLDRRPGWGGGKVNATTVLLETLSAEETDELIDDLLEGHDLDADVNARVRAASEGNPLFVEEMVAMLRESSAHEVVIPPTIQALLAARLDQLEPAERVVLERGAVEGQVFHLGAVRALGSEEHDLRARLGALVRKELVRPERPQVAGEEAFRFRHLLIRDAAYDALPKAVRAELHERFADWLAESGAGLVELDEIVGYHLEQAYRYRAELGPAGATDRALAVRASARLAAAGSAADTHGDSRAACNLLGRALALLPDEEPAVDLRLELADTLHWEGRLAEAHAHAVRAQELALASGDRAAELRSALCALHVDLGSDPAGVTEELRTVLAEALPLFEELGDDRNLLDAWKAVGDVALMSARFDEVVRAGSNVLAAARRLENRREQANHLVVVAVGLAYGSTRLADAERWLDDQEWLVSARPFERFVRGMCRSYEGRSDEARALTADGRAILREQGRRPLAAGSAMWAWDVETHAGDHEAALRVVSDGCDELEELGERGYLSSARALGAVSHAALGNHEEAVRWASQALEIGSDDDVLTLVLAHRALARVALRRGALADAEQLARRELSFAETMESPVELGTALSDLARVRAAAGEARDATPLAERAAALFAAKGDLVMERRTRALVAEIGAPLSAPSRSP